MSIQPKDRVVYVATGERYIREAAASMRSLWHHNPGTPVTMYVDRRSRGSLGRLGVPDSAGTGLLEILDHPEPTYSWTDKPIALSGGDHERVLYLDTDTRICGSIIEILELLSPFDLVAAHASIRLDPRQPESVARRVPRTFPELNTGVIAFRRNRAVAEFLDRWRLLHLEILDSMNQRTVGDQAAFRIALYDSGLRFSVLTPEYNCRFKFPTYIHGPVKILHGRWPDLERIERKLNQTSEPRVYVPGFGILKAWRRLAAFRRRYRSWRKQGWLPALRQRLEGIPARDPRTIAQDLDDTHETNARPSHRRSPGR
jgi:hypothetical protein